ncbi:Acyl-CoA thioesterase I [Pseudomonas syringae pv. delphinii]|uniref:Acyl-CoA thioesterase I n=12 Tax=Pseudomonas syringae group TaxID=136849 RepID=A0A3M4BVF9_9PSED|nr:Acyl-CoA thioesterase I [Pseudomonas syringae pv. delphinii]RMQ22323.1 Acyl-CoA thioesterase I [Pseudomonas syringae pv. delphinii]RMQ25092.1 Acyl-CoA thioesterase I [Pseudomonas syringae pv. actinidiae]
MARWSSSSSLRLRPDRMTEPALGRSSPASNPSRVDLPEPEAPTMASVSPLFSSRESSCRMVRSPSVLGTTLLRLWALRILSLMENPMRAWFLSAGLGLLLLSQGAMAGTVLIVGDSISAAFGLDTRVGWVSLLEQRLKAEGYTDKVVNASISGDTSAGGQARLPALLAEHKPELVILELGGNDGLRGQQPAQLQQNLSSMIDSSRAAGARVLLLGMQIPPNYGPRYTTAFKEVYSHLAEEKKVPFVPFFLEGVGGVPGLMQADGLHPAAAAQGKLLENVWPSLKPLL